MRVRFHWENAAGGRHIETRVSPNVPQVGETVRMPHGTYTVVAVEWDYTSFDEPVANVYLDRS